MRHVDDYQHPARVKAVAREIHATITRPWTLMEICGGQTHGLMRYGLMALLPDNLTLVHGPGCPVCVTDASVVDAAIALAKRADVTLYTFGDMLRVPGTATDLASARAQGADVRVVDSALASVHGAKAAPEKTAVFFGIGFETTVPTFAAALSAAEAMKLNNWTLLLSTVRVPPAIDALLSDPDHRLDGFLAAGHVCTVQGTAEYEPLVQRHRVPMVVAGFEPLDLMEGIRRCVAQLEEGRAEVENAYPRSVRPQGNPAAQALVARYFEPVDRPWRGMGVLPMSGLGIRPAWARFDALARFGLTLTAAEETSGCRSGEVLTGKLRPDACPHFGAACTPANPLGATMVSAEGACSAYYRYAAPAPLSPLGRGLG